MESSHSVEDLYDAYPWAEESERIALANWLGSLADALQEGDLDHEEVIYMLHDGVPDDEEMPNT